MDFFEKLYIARSLLSLNQKEAADRAGISQVAIGNLERGERNAIPLAYANFLYKNGVDLNWVFNKEEYDGNVFRKGENINNSNGKLPGECDDKNIFINQELLETKHLTYILIKHLEKLHIEISRIKKLNKI